MMEALLPSCQGRGALGHGGVGPPRRVALDVHSLGRVGARGSSRRRAPDGQAVNAGDVMRSRREAMSLFSLRA